jgi:hypothetical protein
LNAPFSSQFADCIATPVQTGNIYQWYNKSAFAAPAAGRFGTCGTNNLSGPGLINADLGINRNFRLSERFTLGVRGDMFNTGNTPHHVLGNTSINSSTFMQAVGILNTGLEGIEQRAVRLSMRLAW